MVNTRRNRKRASRQHETARLMYIARMTRLYARYGRLHGRHGEWRLVPPELIERAERDCYACNSRRLVRKKAGSK